MVKKRSGFTIIEAIIVMAIIGLFVMMGPRLLVNTVRFIQLHTAKVEIQRDARTSLDIVNRFLRQAQAATVVVDQVSGQPPFSRISFTTIQGQTMSFYQQWNKLYQGADSTIPITSNLRYIAFTYPRSDDPTIISVAMTMEKATYEGGRKALELSIEKVRIMN
jgi:prepilin-type N-terminal cleavage/methylation domain-containing protein